MLLMNTFLCLEHANALLQSSPIPLVYTKSPRYQPQVKYAMQSALLFFVPLLL